MAGIKKSVLIKCHVEIAKNKNKNRKKESILKKKVA